MEKEQLIADQNEFLDDYSVAREKWRAEVESTKSANLNIVKSLTANYEAKLKALKEAHDQELVNSTQAN